MLKNHSIFPSLITRGNEILLQTFNLTLRKISFTFLQTTSSDEGDTSSSSDNEGKCSDLEGPCCQPLKVPPSSPEPSASSKELKKVIKHKHTSTFLSEST